MTERDRFNGEKAATDRVKEEAVRLGVTYGLVSKWTSFVAVEERETPVEGKMELRKVPIALTRGWGGLEDMAFPGAARSMAIQSSRMLCASAPAFLDSIGDASEGHGSSLAKGVVYEEASFSPVPRASEPLMPKAPRVRAGTSAERPLDRLVALQHADGSWDFTKDLADILGRPLAELEATIKDATGDKKQIRRAWATALAVIWLKIEAHEWAAEWTLLEKKARKWLDRCPARPASGKDWLEAAAEVVS